MKIRILSFCVVCFLFLLTLPISAYEMPDAREYIPDEVSSVLPEGLSDAISENDAESGVSILFSLLKDTLKSLLKPVLKSFSLILAVVILSSLISAMSQANESGTAQRMYSYFASLSLGVILYRMLLELWENAYSVICSVTSLMNSMTVAESAVYAISGNVVSAAASGAQTMIAITVVEDICRYGVMPVLQLCFGFSLISCASDNINMSAVSGFVRKAFTTLLVFVMSILSAVMAFQGVLSRAGDSMAMRTVKLVSGHFIPIVGGFVSEAANTLAGGMGVLKSTVGIAGVVALLILLAVPVMTLLLNRISLDLCNSICCVLSQDKQGRILSEVSGLMNFIIAFLCCIGLMFSINLIIFANSVSGVGV